MFLSAASTSSNRTFTTAAALVAMLEKEQYSYRRRPPNPHFPLAEYTQDRSLLINWCRKVVVQGKFRSPGELVQTVSTRGMQYVTEIGDLLDI